MKNKLLLWYYRLAKAASGKRHACAITIILFLLGLYFPLKDVWGLSISNLAGKFLTPTAGDTVKILGNLVIAYAAISQAIILASDFIGLPKPEKPEPESINQCVLRINDEIRAHMHEVITSPEKMSATFLAHHRFKENIAIVTANMAEHLLRCFVKLKIDTHDIFFSVYQVNGFENDHHEPKVLEYVTHWDLKRQDVVSSTEIKINDPSFSNYECIKAIRGGQKIIKKWDCGDYAASRSGRNKTIKHYVGFRLESNERTIGFINVEFHNHLFFLDDKEMTDFVEKVLMAFRYLIEYQFIKKKFFNALQPHLNQQEGK